MGINSTLAYKILNHLLMGTTSIAASTNILVGLYNVLPSDSTAGVEISNAGYDRIVTTGWTFLGRQAWNTTAITFPTATENWSTAKGFGIFDSTGSSANTLYFGALDTERIALSGDVLKFNATSILIQFLASTDA
jgi:hypothetical protein